MNISAGVHDDLNLAQAVQELALEGYEKSGEFESESREKYRWLRELGSSLWLDTGDAYQAEKVWGTELEALTTNNTLVNHVVQTGVMDGLVSFAAKKIRSARPDISLSDLVLELGFLVNAKLALTLVKEFGAHVSVELHPDVGFDVERSLTFARRYFAINPSHFYIKLPLTPEGFIASRRLHQEGIPVNFTLGFSARQNYLATLFSQPKFVNVFLGRLNSLVEENKLGKPENVGEKVALASYEAVRNLRMANPNIHTQQIAASMRSGEQVVTLAGIDVLTIPPKVAEEYLNLNITQNDIRRISSDELKVDLSTDKPVEVSSFETLWEIDEPFIAFVADAVKQADQMTSGNDLVVLSEKHGVNLFNRWTAEDRQKIREKGKIPSLSQWPGVPLDDLMSISALETFAKDQVDLDERIHKVVGEVLD